MAHFPKDYFQGETRDGFYIEPMMKCAWAAEIEVLEVVAEICEKHNLRYFAAYGTLLGAVRHQGFIPWDDDLDICMLRKDYEQFLQIAPAEFPNDWRVHSVYDNPFHNQLHAYVKNMDRIDYSPEHLKRFHGCPYSVGLDIYPLDTLAPTPEEDRIICDLLKILVHTAKTYEKDPQNTLEMLPEIENMCNVTLDRSGNIKNQLMQLANRVAQLYDTTEGSEIYYYAGHANNPQLRFPASWYSECITLPFETITVKAPKEYDSILRLWYGDYMTPVRDGQSHDYPFYKHQENMFAECWVEMHEKENR